MFVWFHKLGSPPHVYRLSSRLTPWLGGLTLALLAIGTFWGLVIAPPDYQQSDSYRIIFIHVPSAWLSMFVYVVMATAGGVALVWRMKLAEVVMRQAAPLGASFTLLTLITGSLWGKPMWGTWWEWDARMTSELILLFLYLGVIALQSAFEDPRTGTRAAAILALAGTVNIPIIHYSVVWWNTLHQGPTITKLDTPSITLDMLLPLLVMALAFKLCFVTLLLKRMRCDLLESEASSGWVRRLRQAQGAEISGPGGTG